MLYAFSNDYNDVYVDSVTHSVLRIASLYSDDIVYNQ